MICRTYHKILRSDEGNLKRDKKRASVGDGISENGSNKRITSGKISDAIMSVNEVTPVNASSGVTLGVRGSYLNYKYNNRDKPPFTIQVQPVDDAGSSSLHPLHMNIGETGATCLHFTLFLNLLKN